MSIQVSVKKKIFSVHPYHLIHQCMLLLLQCIFIRAEPHVKCAVRVSVCLSQCSVGCSGADSERSGQLLRPEEAILSLVCSAVCCQRCTTLKHYLSGHPALKLAMGKLLLSEIAPITVLLPNEFSEIPSQESFRENP